MTLDPSMNLVRSHQGTTMALWQRIADLERRLRTVETSRPTFQVTNGAPTTAARPGTPAIDAVNGRAYWYYGSPGAWHYVPLT